MKRIITATLALTLLLLAGCSGKPAAEETTRTPQELTTLYTDAITANGGEMVEYNPVVNEVNEESSFLLEMMGLKQEDMTAFGISASMMNVKAYGIAAVMPAQGKEETVRQALQGFIDQKKAEFEFYLPDQSQVAQSARLETLKDGTVLMVMTEGQDEIFDAISKAIQG